MDNKTLLIEYLKKQKGFVKQADVISSIPQFQIDGRCDHDSTSRVYLTKLIKEINQDMEIEHLIIHSMSGIKLATVEEARAFADRQIAESVSKLNYSKKIDKKIGLDRHIDITGYEHKIGV